MATDNPSYDIEKDNAVRTPGELTEIKSLTDWENEPTVRDLRQDFLEAKSSHASQISKINTWLDNLNITGSARLPKQDSKSSFVPKLIRKQAEWRYASLSEPFLSTDDLFNMAPISYEDKKAAYQNELVLNNQFNTKIQKVKFIDEYIRTAVDEGTVVVKVGWDYEEEIEIVEITDYEFQPSNDPIIQQEFIQLHQAM